MARIFVTHGQNMFAKLVVYSCHVYKYYVYVAKYSQLCGWNIPIEETIFFKLWLGFRVERRQLNHLI
jgi:hypothetical protein